MSTKLKIALVAAILSAVVPSTLSATTVFTGTLLGSNEVPASGSAATGFITVTLSGDLLTVNESFTGLSASATAAHIHCCAPQGTNTGVAIPFTGFPTTTAGTYTNTFDLTLAATYNSTFLSTSGGTAAAAEAVLIAGLNSFQAYANIHDANFPGGEIRAQLTPEPASVGLTLLGLGAMLLGGRARKSARNS